MVWSHSVGRKLSSSLKLCDSVNTGERVKRVRHITITSSVIKKKKALMFEQYSTV